MAAAAIAAPLHSDVVGAGAAGAVSVSDADDDIESVAEATVAEVGPPTWDDASDPRCSYLWRKDADVDAGTLHDAEKVLVPRDRERKLRPWVGWEPTRVIARVPRLTGEVGCCCRAYAAQSLWDGEWVNSEVRCVSPRPHHVCLLVIPLAESTCPTPPPLAPQVINTILGYANLKCGGLRADAAASASGGAAAGGTVPVPAAATPPRLKPNGAPDGAPPRVFIWDTYFFEFLMKVRRSGLARFRPRHAVPPTHVPSPLTPLQDGGYSFDRVKNWAKRFGLDVLNIDWIIVAIHLPGHYVLAVIDVPAREGGTRRPTTHFTNSLLPPPFAVHYYDSIRRKAEPVKVFEPLIRWLSDASDLAGARISTTGWSTYAHPASVVPQQRGGVDCGEVAFDCMFLLTATYTALPSSTQESLCLALPSRSL